MCQLLAHADDGCPLYPDGPPEESDRCQTCFVDEDGGASACPECEGCHEHCDCHHCVACGSPSADEPCGNCDNCDDCCRCSQCENCDARFDESDECARCSNCPDCCSCVTCPSCDRRRYPDDICSNCDECSRCCCCRRCDDCEQLVRDEDWSCSECSRCSSCGCCCEEESEGNKFLYQPSCSPVFHTASKAPCCRNPSRRFVSVEIEVDETDGSFDALEKACRKWKAASVTDGSLSDDGFEINTAPAAGDKFVEQVTDICGGLAAANAKVSTACGLHVHADARDLSYWDIRRLAKAYAHVETALFSMVPASRQCNNYCRRCGPAYVRAIDEGLDPRKLKEKVLGALYYVYDKRQFGKNSGRDPRKNKYEDARYNALNLHSWFYRGTVENRMFNGTTDPDKIIRWGALWAGVLDWCVSHTDKQLEELKRLAPLEALKRLAPTDEVRAFVDERVAKHGQHATV